MKHYTCIEDPAHGWIGVPLSELIELDIATKITPYSYLDGFIAWLEEDKDVFTWITALANRKGKSPAELYNEMVANRVISTTHVEKTYIRNLPAYQCPTEDEITHWIRR